MSTTIQILSDIKRKIKARLLWIILLSSLSAALVSYFVSKQLPIYSTQARIFPLSINKSGGSPLDAIKAQFGISEKTDFERIYNVSELVRSKSISFEVAKAKPLNKKYPTLSDWLIEDYNLDIPFWKDKLVYDKKDINTLHYQGSFVLLENTKIVNDEKTGFTSIITSAHDAKLAQEMNETILRELSAFYIRFVTEKPRSDLHKIQLIRDSLKVELHNIERAIAGFIDANQLSVKTSTQLPQFKLIRSQKEIEQLYTTASTSYQNAKFKLLSESPIFQILDAPGPPYGYLKPSWKKYGGLTFILMLFLSSLFFCRQIFGRLIVEELSKA